MNIHKVLYMRIKEEEVKLKTAVVTKYTTEYIYTPAIKFKYKVFGSEWENGRQIKVWIQFT